MLSYSKHQVNAYFYRGDGALDMTGWGSGKDGEGEGRVSGVFTLFDLTGETDLDFLWGCSRLITFDFTGLRIRSPGKNTFVRENVCGSKIFAFKTRKILKNMNKPFSFCFFLSSLLPSNWVTTTALFFTFSLILLHRRAFWEMLSKTVTIGRTPFRVGPSYLKQPN